MLETAGKIVNRMAEMKGMATGDPMKSDQDIESYNNEFHDLQLQLHQIAQQTFNGASIFANTWSELEGRMKMLSLKVQLNRIIPLIYLPAITVLPELL